MENYIKRQIKAILGFIRCYTNGCKAKAFSGIYIGKEVNIVGGEKIFLAPNVVIRPQVDIWCSGDYIKIGRGSEIGERSRISINNRLEIGQNVLLSPNIYITDCDHEYRKIDVPIINQGIVNDNKCVEIKSGAYIGINSVIVGNVIIGKNSVIGANSVVTKSIPDYSVAVGSPARVIKKYNLDTKEWEKVDNEDTNACQLEDSICR